MTDYNGSEECALYVILFTIYEGSKSLLSWITVNWPEQLFVQIQAASPITVIARNDTAMVLHIMPLTINLIIMVILKKHKTCHLL